MKEVVAIRGGGDIATGIAAKLHNCGFRVLVLEIKNPLVIRRSVAFAEAIFDGETTVEGIKGTRVEGIENIIAAWKRREIPVIVDEQCHIIKSMDIKVLVDGIMAKKNLGTNRSMAALTIGIGPGFEAGIDVDVVIETQRGHDLGRLIWSGKATPNTGIPGIIMGYSRERVVKAPWGGNIKNLAGIGEIVKSGQLIAKIEAQPVYATIDGVLRGIIREGSRVEKGLKIADIDPRGIKEHCFTISDKARTIAGGVLESIFVGRDRCGNTIV